MAACFSQCYHCVIRRFLSRGHAVNDQTCTATVCWRENRRLSMRRGARTPNASEFLHKSTSALPASAESGSIIIVGSRCGARGNSEFPRESYEYARRYDSFVDFRRERLRGRNESVKSALRPLRGATNDGEDAPWRSVQRRPEEKGKRKLEIEAR